MISEKTTSSEQPSNGKNTLSYLRAIFAPDDTVLIQMLKKGASKDQTALLHDITEADIAAFPALQEDGWNMYVAMNAIDPVTKRRRKQDITGLRTLYLDIDHDGDNVITQLQLAVFADTVPEPTFIIQSSPGKYYVIWLIEGFTREQQEGLLRALQQRFGTDPSAVDCSRVLRLPGTKNLKYLEQPVCEILECHDIERRYRISDFNLRMIETKIDYAEPNSEKQAANIEYLRCAAAEASFELGPSKDWGGAIMFTPAECLNAEHHSDGNPSGMNIIIQPSGAYAASCFHSHCKSATQADSILLDWPYVRAAFEKMAGHFLRFGDPAPSGLIISGRVVDDTDYSPEEEEFGTQDDFDERVEQAKKMLDEGKSLKEINDALFPLKVQQPQGEFDIDKEFPRLGMLGGGGVRLIFDGFMSAGTNFFGSLSGAGKTWIGLSCAKALTTGAPLFGVFKTVEVMPVIYMIPETYGGAFQQRAGYFGIPDDGRLFRARTITEGLAVPLDDPRLLKTIEYMHDSGKYPHVMVIIDTLIRFLNAGQNENSSSDNMALAKAVDQLKLAGADILFMHHSKKDAGEAIIPDLQNTLRGSGDFGAMADTVYCLRPDTALYASGDGPNEVEVINVKPRDINPPAPFRLKLQEARPSPEADPISVIERDGDLGYIGTMDSNLSVAKRLACEVAGNPKKALGTLAKEFRLGKEKVKKMLNLQGWIQQCEPTQGADGKPHRSFYWSQLINKDHAMPTLCTSNMIIDGEKKTDIPDDVGLEVDK